ncbi:MAG: hypothetical protein ABIH23_26370 [bacterium]
MRFPRIALVEQTFPRPQVKSLESSIVEPLKSGLIPLEKLKDKNIAVGVGSRGINRIAEITKITIQALQSIGAKPFIFPAMGSHGGGTAEGQLKVLAEYGVTADSMGIPIHSSMETVQLESTEDDSPVFFDKNAYNSDGVFLINRVTRHSDFDGEIESGLHKMVAIGMGKEDGALACHSRSSLFPYEHVIRSVAKKKLETGKILGAVAILENAYHETAKVEVVEVSQFEEREVELLREAKSMMPSLPVDSADILIVDRIGKDISGSGMDPKIIGRRGTINSRWQDKPDITRIIALDLTEETNGNCTGLGWADFCVSRLINKIDRKSSYTNAIACRNLMGFNIPIHFDTDRETVQNALASLGSLVKPETARLLRIRDTLSLSNIFVSESLLPGVKNHPNVTHVNELQEMAFDEEGNLISFTDMRNG